MRASWTASAELAISISFRTAASGSLNGLGSANFAGFVLGWHVLTACRIFDAPALIARANWALACRFTPAGFSCSTAFSPLYWLQSLLRGESDVASGTVKWFNGQKGYGFIAPDTGGKDVFVHISAVEKAGLDGLPDGAKVTFDIVPNRGKESAENLRVK